MKKSVRKGCTTAFVVLVVIPLIVIILAIAWVRANDSNWPEAAAGIDMTPALVLQAEDIAETNAFYLVRQHYRDREKPERTEAYDREQERYQKEGWIEGAYPALLAAAHSNDFSALHRAAGMDFCQVAYYGFMGNIPRYPTAWMRDAKTLSLLSLDLASRGEWDAVQRNLQTQCRLSSKLTRGSNLIGYLVGMAGLNQALGTIQEIDERYACPPAVSTALITEARHAVRQMQSLGETLRHEFTGTDEVVRATMSGQRPGAITGNGMTKPVSLKLWRQLGSNPNTTTQHMEDLFSHLVKYAESDGNDQASHDLVFDFMMKNKAKMPMSFLSDDPMGRIFISLLLPATEKIPEKRKELDVRLHGTAQLQALRRFERANSAPPKTLAVLVPDYLPELPADPFCQPPAPFRYRAEGDAFLVYSVGPDGEDNSAEVDGFDRKARRKADTWDLPLRSDHFQRKRAEATAQSGNP